jgi:para-aminobenzoate synthetase component 1
MNLDLEDLVKFFTQKGTVILLESQSTDHPWSRKSYLAAVPQAEIKARNNQATIIKDEKKESKKGNPWKMLQKFRREQDDWLFGYLGYDLKNHTEDLSSKNPDEVKAPDLYFMNPSFLLEFNRLTGDRKVLKGDLPGTDEINAVLKKQESFFLLDFQPTITQNDYVNRIQQIQHGISEGDFYEINLSHQMKGDFTGNAMELYHQMKKVGPVPFGGYIQMDEWAVCCQSPERFLRKEGSTVFSQPIKGTSKRGQNKSEDEILKNQLFSSAKERAENLMIVDLVRNDLSRIAQRGSVEVSKLFNIESFGTVHQMVSTITAAAEVKDPIVILRACFPMGSMTGAPKISAMKAIEKLENYRRGIYSGAIGYITGDGDFDFNVVIRTAIIRNNNLYYSVGGAITSDSDPHEEWRETQIKAQALLEVLQNEKKI